MPVRADLAVHAAGLGARARQAALRLAERRRADLRALARALPAPDEVTAAARQRADLAGERLAQTMRGGLEARALALSRLGGRLRQRSPHAKLAGDRQRLNGAAKSLLRAKDVSVARRRSVFDALVKSFIAARAAQTARTRERLLGSREKLVALHARLAPAFAAGLRRRRDALGGLDQMRLALGYTGVLARGFALVRGAGGAALRSARAVAPGERLDIQFADGNIGAVADGASPKRAAAVRKDQGSLF